MSEPSYRLLVADDEPWVVENLRNLIDWEGFSIAFLPPAFDGEAALDRIASEQPDILITDINMPFIDGNALIRAAKERFPGLQSIVLSGYYDFPFVRDALLHGAVDYLLKPITKNSLMEVLEKTLRLLGSKKDREREESELRDRLRSASSILRDVEMSDVIVGSPFGLQDKKPAPPLDLDLEFASYTLVLVRLVKGQGGIASLEDRKNEEIKTIIAGLSHGAKQIVFHNLYARSEFVLIADLDSKGLSLALDELPDRIRRRMAMTAGVGASGCHYSFDQVRTAYQEARAAFMIRPIGKKTPSGGLGSGGREVTRRIRPELERRLTFALESRNRQMSLDIMFDEIGLRGCEESGWLLIEAKQTAEYMAGMIYHRADPGPSASAGSLLAMDTLSDLLLASLEREDIPETCSVLEQLLDEALGEPVSPGASRSMIGAARRAEEYIREHYFEDISLTSIAAFFHFERAYLSKAFKEVTGCNIMLAIAKTRIAKACDYMRNPDFSLTDVADLVGYPEYAYFNRVFRKVAGMSPSEYRLSMRGAE